MKFKKPYNLILIFTLIGVFFVNSTAYAMVLFKPTQLRAPLIFDQEDNVREVQALMIEVVLEIQKRFLTRERKLVDTVRIDPDFRDDLDRLDVELCLDRLARPWVYCEELAVYFYVDNDRNGTVKPSTVEELIKMSSIKGLPKLIGVFADEDNLEMLKDEFLFRFQRKPFSVMNPLIGALSDPDSKYVEFSEEVFLEILKTSKTNRGLVLRSLAGALDYPGSVGSVERIFSKAFVLPRIGTSLVLNPLRGALANKESKKFSRNIFLKLAEINQGAVTEFLEEILKKEKRRHVISEATEMLGLIRGETDHVSSKDMSRPKWPKPKKKSRPGRYERRIRRISMEKDQKTKDRQNKRDGAYNKKANRVLQVNI